MVGPTKIGEMCRSPELPQTAAATGAMNRSGTSVPAVEHLHVRCGSAFPLEHDVGPLVEPGRPTGQNDGQRVVLFDDRRPPDRLGRQIASTHHVGPNPAVLGPK